MQSIEWYHFQWPYNDLWPRFPGYDIFEVEYWKNGAS